MGELFKTNSGVPYATRDTKKEELFRTKTDDFSKIHPDAVSAAVEGYFRFPAVWIGAEPEMPNGDFLDYEIHHEIVYRRDLSCDVRVCVRRDGTFLFDFSKWSFAPLVIIPGYEFPGPNITFMPPPEYHRKCDLAENYAVLRAQVMNVHQACISTAEQMLLGRNSHVGAPVTAWSTDKAISFATVPSYADDSEDMHALARNVANNKDGVIRNKMHRPIIDINVIDKSCLLLEEILLKKDMALIQIVEAVYIAASRANEKRFGESVMLAWGACEQLISILWKRKISEAKSSGKNISSDRFDKLKGRDYTASLMIEMLDLDNRINDDLYKMLEGARKARNKWAHEMRPPKQTDANVCVEAAQKLLKLVADVDLAVRSGSRGAAPAWWIWWWEEMLANGGP